MPKTTASWLFLVMLALGAMGFGIYAFSEQYQQGFIVTGLRNPGYGAAAWGLYIAFDVFFVGVSFAGITVAAICRLFDIATLKPITRMAELLTICALLAGGSVVLADLGRPIDGLLKLPRYANPSSPFYGTFTLVVAGYMFSSLVYFFLAGRVDAAALAADPNTKGRFFYKLWASGYKDLPQQQTRHHSVSFWLALTILPLLVTAHSTLGFIFGLQGARPGWFGSLMAPAFVVLAGVSGTGMVILVGLGFRRLFKLHDRLPDSAFRWLGNFLWVLALVYIYFMIIDELTASYGGPAADRHVAHEVVTGAFAPVFWTCAGSLFLAFLLPFIMYVVKGRSLIPIALASILANVAAVCKRFLIVVPSQTHGALISVEAPRMYHPTWIEYGAVIGLLGLIATAMLLFGRFFPLVPSPHPHHDHVPLVRDLKRRGGSLLTALIAGTLIVVGLSDSFRLWSGPEKDPRIPYAPVIFATGVMLLFASAIVFELFPEKIIKKTWAERKREHLMAQATKAVPWGGRDVEHRYEQGTFEKLAQLAASAEELARVGDRHRALNAVREMQRLSSILLPK